ncbi:MAG TPA: hypothetical protein VGI76_01260 [Solirubrobacteraceae bacterium]
MSARRLGSFVGAWVGAWLVVFLSCQAIALAASAPTVDREFSANVGVSTATIEAEINPQEVATSYHFEYGTGASYGTSAPLSDAAIGAGASGVVVTLPLAGLQAGTSYHYRVVATNAEGATAGPDHVLKTSSPEVEGGASCSNALIRGSQSASYLPDCRAYEMVSPASKKGANIAADASQTQSSLSGDAIKYYSTAAFGDAQGIATHGAEYVSQRGATGWTTHGINPEQSSTTLLSSFTGSQYQYLSPDLSEGVYFALTPVTPGHPDVERAANLYLRDDILSGPPGNYELLSDCPACGSIPLPPRSLGAFGLEVAFAGASADLGHVFFESVNKLTPEAAATNPAGPKLYEWDRGALRLAGILPNGEPAEVSVAGAGAGGGTRLAEGGWTEDAISTDGDRVVFTAGPGMEGVDGDAVNVGALYMRINHAETIQLNTNERSVPDPGGAQPARFCAATPDGSRVFFTTKEMLTDDSPEHAESLYMYDTKAPAGQRLTLISVDREPGGSDGGGRTVVTGITADGSYVYFAGGAMLVPGQPPFGNSYDALFVWHEGSVRYVASQLPLDPGSDWGGFARSGGYTNFRVDRSGLQAIFTSSDPVTAQRVGYENVGKCETEFAVQPCDETYYYDYTTNKLVCASCDPSGAAPLGQSGFSAVKGIDNAFNFGFTAYSRTQYLNRALSEDGRYVFFDTVDALVPRDTNHRRDVYEYDTATDQVHLISGGTCACDSLFVEIGADGANAFFVTQQRLVRADVDTNADLYDARVNGGIEAQNGTPPAPCEGDDCQGPAGGTEAFAPPSSATFAGQGNKSPLTTQRPAKAKRKAKPKRRRAKHRKTTHRKAAKTGRSTRAATHTKRGVS